MEKGYWQDGCVEATKVCTLHPNLVHEERQTTYNVSIVFAKKIYGE
jgi:hypothetical protein